MKKLMFATALGVSAAAFAAGQAEPSALNATSFEGYTAGQPYLSDKGDIGENGGPKYFCYMDGDADGSSVKEFGEGDNLAAPSITRPFYYATATPNANYLELSTEGGILWRSINEIEGSANAYTLGDPVNIADGIFLDTLVQFTPTEDGGALELTSDDKLAIWLNVDSNQQTNLMVRAGYVDDSGTSTSTLPTNYVLSTTSPVVAGNWYRLTVKIIADVTQCRTKNGEYNPNGITGFEIYLDGVQLAATTTTIASGYIDRATDASEYGWLDQTTDADFITYLQSGKVFPSLKGETSGDSIQGVGFKGSGALDDIVWTEEDPFANAGGDAAWIDDVTQVFVGANLDAAEKAKITAWATANNITVGENQAEIAAAAYLLGQTTLPTAIPELTITSIEEGADTWTLTVAATAGDSALTLPATINGAITLTQAATLTDLGTATASTTGFTATINGTVTVTIAKDSAAAKFMKVGVGLAPAAPPANSGN